MSERMIELQRAKMGLPPITKPSVAGAPTMGGPGGSMGGVNGSSRSATAAGAGGMSASHAPAALTPQQIAAAAIAREDERMQKFLRLVAESAEQSSSSVFDDAITAAAGQRQPHAPTVPTSLSRRILHRQGVGFLDETVASVTSLAADRFLATVLQQAIACRDRRLKGEEYAKERLLERKLQRKRKRLKRKERRRKKQAMEERIREKNLASIAAADALAKSGSSAVGGAAGSSPAKGKSKKSKKAAAAAAKAAANGPVKENGGKEDGKDDNNNAEEEEEALSDDSLDEEEDYYEHYYSDKGSSNSGSDTDEDDEEDEDGDADEDEEDSDDDENTRYTILLRDMSRPLEAWGINLTGKIGLGAVLVNDADEEGEGHDAETVSSSLQQGIGGSGSEGGTTVEKGSMAGSEAVNAATTSVSSSSAIKASTSASNVGKDGSNTALDNGGSIDTPGQTK